MSSKTPICYPGEKTRIDWDSKEISWLLNELRAQISFILKNPKMYIKELNKILPLGLRQGLLPRKWLYYYMDDLYRPEKILGTNLTNKFVSWVEKNHYSEKNLKTINLKTYLNYCKVAYQANGKTLGINDTESGLNLYKRFADNRHEGLLDINPKSNSEFEKWYNSRVGGGHPWEIYRGGNTTHIDLVPNLKTLGKTIKEK